MEGIFSRIIIAAIFALAIGWASAERLRKEFEGSGKDGRRLYSSFSYYAAYTPWRCSSRCAIRPKTCC